MKNLLTLLLLVPTLAFSQNGIAWSNAVQVASGTYGNLHPRISLNGSGNPLVLWGDNAGNAQFSRWSGSGFTTPVRLNPMMMNVFTASWAGPDIAAKGDTIYTVYKSSPEDTGHVYLRSSFNGGISFSSQVMVENLMPGMNKSRFPTVGVDNAGNPVVGFMKFDSGFMNAGWVTAKSSDYGQSFGADVIAGGYSGGEACDCCPGSIASSGNKVAILYRDNLSNLRNMWAGISSDGGISFPSGMAVDNTGWIINACPSSGPDGIFFGDTLYTVFMSNEDRVYWSKTSVSTMQAGSATPATSLAGNPSQNYPRIAAKGKTAAMVWKNSVSGNGQVALLFTPDIQKGFSGIQEIVASDNMNMIANADIAISDGAVHVVWQDDASGKVMYRRGTFTATGINHIQDDTFTIFPNPVGEQMTLQILNSGTPGKFTITNMLGESLYSEIVAGHMTSVNIKTMSFPAGLYFLSFSTDNATMVKRFTISH